METTASPATHDPGVAESADRMIEVRDGTIARDTAAAA